MADELLVLLNSYGYMPIMLPRSGLEPPDLYNLADTPGGRRLIRRGPLAAYLPTAEFTVKGGVEPDIKYERKASKNLGGAVGFLSKALACIGISQVPKLDLSFARSTSLLFQLSGVTYRTVDPSQIDGVVQGMNVGAIPQAYVDSGDLHIVYEYAFARTLLMSAVDGTELGAEVQGNVGEFIDLGAKGKVEVVSATTLSFSGTVDQQVAFGYKAGMLADNEGRWEFYPEEYRQGAAPAGAPESRGTGRPYLPARGVLLDVNLDPTADL